MSRVAVATAVAIAGSQWLEAHLRLPSGLAAAGGRCEVSPGSGRLYLSRGTYQRGERNSSSAQIACGGYSCPNLRPNARTLDTSASGVSINYRLHCMVLSASLRHTAGKPALSSFESLRTVIERGASLPLVSRPVDLPDWPHTLERAAPECLVLGLKGVVLSIRGALFSPLSPHIQYRRLAQECLVEHSLALPTGCWLRHRRQLSIIFRPLDLQGRKCLARVPRQRHGGRCPPRRLS